MSIIGVWLLLFKASRLPVLAEPDLIGLMTIDAETRKATMSLCELYDGFPCK